MLLSDFPIMPGGCVHRDIPALIPRFYLSALEKDKDFKKWRRQRQRQG